MAQVQLTNLVKQYEDTQVVHGINLDIQDKEFLVLLGPSGCGKSTSLRMIAGLESISSGEIKIGNEVVNDIPPKDRNISMVFQNYALFPHMTAYDNISFGMKLAKRPQDEIKKKTNRVADILNLAQKMILRKPKELSGGQQQRVAMARAMVKTPEVFLFDEPLSNLDAKLRTKMRFEIKKLHMSLNTTTIYVTHDQIEAMTLADRIVIMNNGHIAQVGTPKEIFEKPASKFVASFIGDPAMNILKMKVTPDGFLKYGSLSIPVPPHKGPASKLGSEVFMGIRPTDILVNPQVHPLPESWKYEAKVEVVELMGADCLVDIKMNEIELIMQISSDEMPQVGNTVPVYLNLNRLHLFNGVTEKAIE